MYCKARLQRIESLNIAAPITVAAGARHCFEQGSSPSLIIRLKTR